ncbi:MAG: prepilin-type N-terminal cleavage/methylation domain-containing protein [Opitutaceae bacterium]|jgi:type IV pilus assembly protein PilA
MKTLCRSAGAFTLVEIMIVTTIIGMLAALAVPAFYASRQLSRQKAITNNLRQLAAAAQQYMLEQGVSQADFSDLVGEGTSYYIRDMATVCGEDYTAAGCSPVTNGTTQISVSAVVITVTYDL